jgi:small subunit ribosomal protein S27
MKVVGIKIVQIARSKKMWKQITKFSNFRQLNSITTRAYLTEAYKLTSEWDQRLKTPILEKVNIETLYVESCQKFSHKKKINWIDVDIFANKATENNIEDALDLVRMLRTTAEASKMLESTQHAIIRILSSNPDQMLSLLNQRLDYGVFLDSHQANFLLDNFIKEKNFMVAARLATFQMLQEDFENPITRCLSLYACYKFVDNLETFIDLIPPPPPTNESAVPEVSGKKKKIEEIKVRIKYLRNPYFDDHFDITETNHLVGKTLLYLADEVEGVDKVLADSVRLIGFALYQKYENGSAFLDEKKAFYKEAIDKVKSLAEKAGDLNDDAKKFFDKVNAISNSKEGKVDEIIEGLIKQAVQENEAKEIEQQKKVSLT